MNLTFSHITLQLLIRALKVAQAQHERTVNVSSRNFGDTHPATVQFKEDAAALQRTINDLENTPTPLEKAINAKK